MNILVLGESGVGKSTWINAIANYFTYLKFKYAQKARPLILIPVLFSMADSNKELKEIKLNPTVTDSTGLDSSSNLKENEDTKIGESATQFPVTYTITKPNGQVIRIIDTPGICDSRGVEQDRKNLDRILQHLTHYETLHAICILMNSTNSRLSPAFRFCITELLSRLHCNALPNVLFCFTKARETFYKAGEAVLVLKEYLDEIAHKSNAHLILKHETVFYFDNEGFRFLCAHYRDVILDSRELQAAKESWKQAAEETERMLGCIEKNESSHNLAEMISINDARAMITLLTRPMADIMRLIQANLSLATEKGRLIMAKSLKDSACSTNDCAEIDDDSVQQLAIRQKTCIAKALQYPRTVCAAQSCVEYESNGFNQSKTVYKQTCHAHCYLQDVPIEIVNNQRLIECQAMNDAGLCEVCGCSWEIHMHVTFVYEETYENIAEDIITRFRDGVITWNQAVDEVVERVQKQIRDLSGEAEAITAISAKFATFLKANSLAPFNDAYADYVSYLIKNEEQAIANGHGHQNLLDRLVQSLGQYQEEKKFFEKGTYKYCGTTLTPDEIETCKQQLFSLPYSGAAIRSTFNVQYRHSFNSTRHFERKIAITPHFEGQSTLGSFRRHLGSINHGAQLMVRLERRTASAETGQSPTPSRINPQFSSNGVQLNYHN